VSRPPGKKAAHSERALAAPAPSLARRRSPPPRPHESLTKPIPTSPAGRAALLSATHVLTSIPPVATPMYDPVLAAQLELLRWRLAAAAAGEEGPSSQAAASGSPPPPPPPRLAWIGYLSSTGVYGDRGGGWVDESAAPAPSTARGVVRLEHERAWERWAEKEAAAAAAAGSSGRLRPQEAHPALRIFRLGGIYGPGRSVLEPLLGERGGPTTAAGGGGGGGGGNGGGEGSSSAVSGPPPQRARRRRQRFTSRVHVADAARAALASAELWWDGSGGTSTTPPPSATRDGFPPLPARVFNVVDDLPAPRLEVEAYALERLKQAGLVVSQPPASGRDEARRRTEAAAAAGAADAATEPAAAAPPLEEKRVRNDRLKQELLLGPAFGGQLLYPDYRPAIDELVAARVGNVL
jgi:hypothetical protein